MTPNVDDISRQLAALTGRFADLGAKLAEAARALQDAGAPPSDALVEELAEGRTHFTELRAIVVGAGEALGASAGPPPESLKALEPMLDALAQALAAQVKRAALAETRAKMATVLDRVLEVIHGDDPTFAPLLAVQTRANEVRAAGERLEDPASEAAQAVAIDVAAFSDFLTMVEEREGLGDERYARLEEAVSTAFGRPLAMAVARGRLMMRGAEPPPRDVEPEAEPVTSAATPDPRFETERPEPAGEPSPDETAQWWLAAWARWSGWKNTLEFPDAVREELGKYPYLLAVPIQESPEHEDGLLAYGYSILMEHVEKQKPGCVGNALQSLRPQPGGSVGPLLYEYLVTEGGLDETYPEFVKSVLLAGLPEPGLWFQSRILESKDDTRIFRRPTERVGETDQTGQRLSSDSQRYAEHKLSETLKPLTASMHLVASDVKESRGLEVKLKCDGAPSDAAWLVTVPAAGKAGKVTAHRLSVQGSALVGLGKDYAAIWVAVFNADPAAQRRYDVSFQLRKSGVKKS